MTLKKVSKNTINALLNQLDTSAITLQNATPIQQHRAAINTELNTYNRISHQLRSYLPPVRQAVSSADSKAQLLRYRAINDGVYSNVIVPLKQIVAQNAAASIQPVSMNDGNVSSQHKSPALSKN